MTQTITYCARGCVRARRHLPDCTGDCPGCQPRQTETGHLCWPCHRRLEVMLIDAPTIVAWLDIHLPRGTARGARTDAELRRGKNAAPPSPLDLEVLDLLHTWRVTLTGWTDNLCDDRALRGPDDRAPSSTAKFLRKWLTTVETLEWVTDLYDELADLTRLTHAHTPWAPEVRRVRGIPCPECHSTALVVYGGQTDVTCAECRLVIPESRYGIWTRMLADEHRARTA